MKRATRAPVFACLYPGLCDIACARGYALAIHGTVTSDLDLIAIPWTLEAVDPVTLKDAILNHIGACGYRDLLRNGGNGLSEDHIEQIVTRERCTGPDDAEVKPHGRLAWNLYLEAGSKVDLSVMPLSVMGVGNLGTDPRRLKSPLRFWLVVGAVHGDH